MMNFDLLNIVSLKLSLQAKLITQLHQIKCSLEEELAKKMLINQIFIDHIFKSSCPNQSMCLSPPTKVEDNNPCQKYQLQPTAYRPITKRRIWKNKISHNSSLRNDTKNIPKNYGKAILTYIQKSPKTKELAVQMGIYIPDLMIQIRRTKKKVNSIEGLKKMWGSQNLNHKVKKCIRILSYQFMRKHCLRYIFHSKVRNYNTHIKYRQKMIQGIRNPVQFNHIKDY